MLRPTGPGLIDINKTLSYGNVLVATLHNFDIDGETIKPEHQSFLINRVTPLLKDDHGHIWMVGSASRSGTNLHNQELSKKRVANAAAILRGMHILDQQMQLEAIGEERSIGHRREEEMDRGVTLVVYPMPQKSKKPHQIIPIGPKVSKTFKVQMLWAATGDLGVVGAEVLKIRIVDTTNIRVCEYRHTGLNLGPGLPASYTSKGTWTEFHTNKAVRACQFGGITRFTTAGAANATLNYIHFLGLPHGVHSEPRPLRISTGTTYGAGGTTGGGYLKISDDERPFEGDN